MATEDRSRCALFPEGEDVVSMTSFDGGVYVATNVCIYRVSGDKLRPLKMESLEEARAAALRQSVLDGLMKANVDMSKWKNIEILHLRGATKVDPLDQFHWLGIKASVDGELRCQLVKTVNDRDGTSTDRLIAGLVRVIKDDGLLPLSGPQPETTV